MGQVMNDISKAKRKHSPSRGKRWVIVIGTLLLVIFVFAVLLPPVTLPAYDTKTSLDAEYLPTVQYLLENPEPANDLVSLRPESSGNVCVVMRPPYGLGRNAYFYSEINLNGYPASFFQSFCFPCEVVGDGKDCECRCFYSNSPYLKNNSEKLAAGIHLLEVRIKYSPYENPVHIHRWAFEIE